jgi:hypothetical protein
VANATSSHGGTTAASLTSVPKEPLTVRQTATGYWVVQRGSVQLAGAMTREAAEAERELLTRLARRTMRRNRNIREESPARLRPRR